MGNGLRQEDIKILLKIGILQVAGKIKFLIRNQIKNEGNGKRFSLNPVYTMLDIGSKKVKLPTSNPSIDFLLAIDNNKRGERVRRKQRHIDFDFDSFISRLFKSANEIGFMHWGHNGGGQKRR